MKQTSKIAAAIAAQIEAPFLLTGEPGTGKTSFIDGELARQLDWPVSVIYVSSRDPVELAGLYLQDPENGKVHLAHVGKWLDPLLERGYGLLFLDELSTLTSDRQAAVQAVINERRAGDLKFPHSIVPCAAMNPAELAAGGIDLAASLANRMIHIPWEASASIIADGLLNRWQDVELPKLTKNWQDSVLPLAATMSEFFKKFPRHAQACPKEASKRCEAWPSARSWDKFALPSMAAVASLLATQRLERTVLEDVEGILVSGSVGTAATTDLFSWRRNLDIPDVEAMLANPSKFVMLDRMDKNFVFANSLAAAVVSNFTPQRWEAFWEILYKMAEKGHKSIGAVACRSVAALGRDYKGKAKLPNVMKYIEPYEMFVTAAANTNKQ